MRNLSLTLVALVGTFAVAGCDGAFGRSTSESPAPAASATPAAGGKSECCELSAGSSSAGAPVAATPASATTGAEASGTASPECKKACEGMTEEECEEACEEACVKKCDQPAGAPCPKNSEPAAPAR